VSGALEDLKKLFQMLNPKAVDIMFTPTMLSGGFRGTFPFFKLNPSASEPFNAFQWLQVREFIGPVHFLWSQGNSDSKNDNIWLFCHPSITSQVVLNLRSGIQHCLQHKNNISRSDFCDILKIQMVLL
jgi:hypothetical protein